MLYTLIIEDRHGIIDNELTFERGNFTIGRVETSDIQLPSPTVSRQHARIFTDSGHCFVEDLNSSNGVVVDGERIYGTAELTSGSQIRVGDYLLVLKSRSRSGQFEVAAMTGRGRSGRHDRARAPDSLMYPRLVRVADALEGETFALTERENTLGRTDDNIILLSDPSVSRRHAKVIIDHDRYVLTDLGSSNGTRINDQLVRQPTLIVPGDVLRFGNVRFALAAPGQTIDLREYSRFIGSSGRGLVIAVTILALLLVLVASGIGIFVILERRAEPAGSVSAPSTNPANRARELKRDGDTLAQAEQWNEAIVKYELALNFDPNYEEAAFALRRAQSEFNASRIVQEADMTIHSADSIERQGNRSEAATFYARARQRLLAIPSDSTYYRSAHDRVTMLVDPALIDIHRRLGAERAQAGDPEAAAQHYQQALDIWQGLPEDRRSDIRDDLRTRLWNALVSAGDTTFEAERYAAAVGYYERAAAIGELRDEAASQLRQARERL